MYTDDERKSVKKMKWKSLFILITFSTTFGLNPVQASEDETTVYVNPLISFASPGDHFNVSIEVVDAVNIYSWQVYMSFNNTLLECVNATEGDFLATQPATAFYIAIDNTEGYVGFGASITGEHPGVNGSGTLGFIEFKVLAESESLCVLNITHPLTYLIESVSLNEIDPRKENGYFVYSHAYEQLLADYSALLADYNTLNSSYHSLLADYQELLGEYENLESDYASLDATYTSLLDNYTSLQTDHNSLQSEYDNLGDAYTSLETIHNSLNSTYNSLKTDYENLESEYQTSTGELKTAGNLNHVLLGTTIVFIASTAYLLGYIRTLKAKAS